MMTNKVAPVIDRVIYNFRKNGSLNIDVVPIAERLLTEKTLARTSAPHRANFYRIIWFQTGSPVHTVDFEQIEIESPAILFVHKDKIHKFDKKAAHDGKVLIFTNDFFFRTQRDRNFLRTAQIFNQTGKPILLPNADERLVSLFNLIEFEIGRDKQLFKSEASYHLLNSFLYTAERIACAKYPALNNNSPNVTLANLFFQLVEDNFKKRFSVEKYAALANVSSKKLNLAIQEVKGKTGKQVITERLLLEAKRLLVHSDASAKEIGYELGFDEPTNFIKFFKKNAKQTPIEFQKANR